MKNFKILVTKENQKEIIKISKDAKINKYEFDISLLDTYYVYNKKHGCIIGSTKNFYEDYKTISLEEFRSLFKK